MADPTKVAELVEVLGRGVDGSGAAALLLAADGNLELAVSMFFASEEQAPYSTPLALCATNSADEAGPSNLNLSNGRALLNVGRLSAERADPLEEGDSLDRADLMEESGGPRVASRTKLQEKVAMLRELVGPGVEDASLVKKLRKAKGCVNAAANTHFAQVQALQKRREKKESQAGGDQQGWAMSCTDEVMEAAETTGGAEDGDPSIRGPGTYKRPFLSPEDPPHESVLRPHRTRKRLRSSRDPTPEPVPQTTVVISQEEFAYRSQSGQSFMLPAEGLSHPGWSPLRPAS